MLKKISVLCVEDDPTTRYIVKIMLEPFVKELFFAQDGETGYELFTKEHLDVVLTDINMPKMSGLELTRKIRKVDSTLPIVVMTSSNDADIFMEAINSKVSHFIPKPLNQQSLHEILASYAENKHTQEKLSCNSLLLDQYKSVVDESTIVSKTDPKGKITYVNEAFCKISQYSEAELLGKSHNVIRHPDGDPKIFDVMWETIKSGKTWHGVIRNLAKDGTTYIVDSTIKPIINRNGEVIEYIGVRHDISEIVKLNDEIEDTQKELLYTLGELAETHSLETSHHVRRVAQYSKLLAQKFGLTEREVDLLYHATPMHDIGKIAIPDAILNKPGTLDEKEWEIMKEHAERGYKVFKNSRHKLLQATSIIAHEHHERYDGKGYPRGLKGKEIHIYGRIVALADVFDALGSDRVYKKAWELPEILELFKQERGKQFDPVLVDIFLDHFDEFTKIHQTLCD